MLVWRRENKKDLARRLFLAENFRDLFSFSREAQWRNNSSHNHRGTRVGYVRGLGEYRKPLITPLSWDCFYSSPKDPETARKTAHSWVFSLLCCWVQQVVLTLPPPTTVIIVLPGTRITALSAVQTLNTRMFHFLPEASLLVQAHIRFSRFSISAMIKHVGWMPTHRLRPAKN